MLFIVDSLRKKQRVMGTRRLGMASPQYVILAVCSKIDAKRGDHFIPADFSLPNLDREMEFVWTLKHLDKKNWQRSSSVQIKPPRFTTHPLLGLGPRACGLVRKRCTKHVRQHLPRKRSGDEGVQYAVEPAWNDS